MTILIRVHAQDPQPRFIQTIVEVLVQGGVIIYPTDSCYAFGCHIGDKSAMQKIRDIRKVDAKHNFTLVCNNLSEIAQYAKVTNTAYRLIKSLTPGPYTFILNATKEVPRRLQHPKRKTIGFRVPDNRIVHAILEMLGEPMMSSTLAIPAYEYAITDPELMPGIFPSGIALIVDGGPCGVDPTSVLDLTSEVPQVSRVGKGDVAMFLS